MKHGDQAIPFASPPQHLHHRGNLFPKADNDEKTGLSGERLAQTINQRDEGGGGGQKDPELGSNK